MVDALGNKLNVGDFYVYSLLRGKNPALQIGLVLEEGVYLGAKTRHLGKWEVNTRTHRQLTTARSMRVDAKHVPPQIRAEMWANAEKLGYSLTLLTKG
jgi:hypothetical protein